jgi:NAD+ synthase
MYSGSTAMFDMLAIDPVTEIKRIAGSIRETLASQLKRKGVVLGISGGIDSSVVAALCVHAVGRERVVGLLMPEADSSEDSVVLGRKLAENLRIESILENITPALEGAGCYRRRDDAIRRVVPEYGEGYKCKIILPNLLDESPYAIFSIVVESPAGDTKKVRLPLDAYLGVVSATNFKQRVRKMFEYYHADRLNFAVAGTPNHLEYDLGFFVKNGDGSADLKPIAHLYKSQVYQLAAYLGVPEEIQRRPPTTDTYSLEQSQEEFYFNMPLAKMDACLYGKNHGISPEDLASVVGFSPEQIARAYSMIDSKRKATRYLHLPPILVSMADQ